MITDILRRASSHKTIGEELELKVVMEERLRKALKKELFIMNQMEGIKAIRSLKLNFLMNTKELKSKIQKMNPIKLVPRNFRSVTRDQKLRKFININQRK